MREMADEAFMVDRTVSRTIAMVPILKEIWKAKMELVILSECLEKCPVLNSVWNKAESPKLEKEGCFLGFDKHCIVHFWAIQLSCL